MPIEDKLKKLEEIGKQARELTELSEGTLSIQNALEVSTGPNFEKLLDSVLLDCVGVAGEVLKIIARKPDA